MEPGPLQRPAPASASEHARRRTSASTSLASPTRSGAYTPKPVFSHAEISNPAALVLKSRLPWLAAAVAIVVAGGGLLWHHIALPPVGASNAVFYLEGSDIDQAATATARAMLARGEIPPTLANVSDQTRREVADGRKSLYSKEFLKSGGDPALAIHVTVTEGSAVVGEDVLTAEHPRTASFPSAPGTPVHFHFLVQNAGPQGAVTCWTNSQTGASVHTAPMPTGGFGDLEAATR